MGLVAGWRYRQWIPSKHAGKDWGSMQWKVWAMVVVWKKIKREAPTGYAGCSVRLVKDITHQTQH